MDLFEESHYGKWEKTRTLGSGGFGCVTLWTNKETNEQLALKQCRLCDADVTDKIHKRWSLEVHIMNRLNHLNIVKALALPDPLRALTARLPTMAMEFCRGGDLRKALNQPENCYGLRRRQVLRIAAHTSAAVEYLHQNKIVHRDLKPENIVLQTTESDSVTYKLIDLGYAKRLDGGSLCTSFVGTLHYLAPELLAGQKPYTNSVDYWSLGLTIFEVITGQRPFLPTLPLVQWHSEITKKSQKHICAYKNVNGEIVMADKIVFLNHLPRKLVEMFEGWFQLMLDLNPAQRGCFSIGRTDRPTCYRVLDDIIAKNIVRVHNLTTNKVHEYFVESDMTLSHVRNLLAQDCSIECDKQVLIDMSGAALAESQFVLPFCSTLEKEQILYLISLNIADYRLPSSVHIPDTVKRLMNNAKSVIRYSEAKRYWANSIIFCEERLENLSSLVNGEKAVVQDIAAFSANFFKLFNDVLDRQHMLKSKLDFFLSAVAVDVSEVREHGDSVLVGFSEKWERRCIELKQLEEQTNSLKQLHSDVDKLKKECDHFQLVVAEHHVIIDCAKGCKDSASTLFNTLRNIPKEERGNRTVPSNDIVRSLTCCVNNWQEGSSKIHKQLVNMISRRNTMINIKSKLQVAAAGIEKAMGKIDEYQKERQQDIWGLFWDKCQTVKKSEENVAALPAAATPVQKLHESGVASASSASAASHVTDTVHNDTAVSCQMNSITSSEFFASSSKHTAEMLKDNKVVKSDMTQLFSTFHLDSNAQVVQNRHSWDFLQGV